MKDIHPLLNEKRHIGGGVFDLTGTTFLQGTKDPITKTDQKNLMEAAFYNDIYPYIGRTNDPKREQSQVIIIGPNYIGLLLTKNVVYYYDLKRKKLTLRRYDSINGLTADLSMYNRRFEILSFPIKYEQFTERYAKYLYKHIYEDKKDINSVKRNTLKEKEQEDNREAQLKEEIIKTLQRLKEFNNDFLKLMVNNFNINNILEETNIQVLELTLNILKREEQFRLNKLRKGGKRNDFFRKRNSKREFKKK